MMAVYYRDPQTNMRFIWVTKPAGKMATAVVTLIGDGKPLTYHCDDKCVIDLALSDGFALDEGDVPFWDVFGMLYRAGGRKIRSKLTLCFGRRPKQ